MNHGPLKLAKDDIPTIRCENGSLGPKASAADTDRVRFEGEGNGRTAVFAADGPWMLDWSIRSDVPSQAIFEMRLHEGASGDYIATT